MYGRHTEHTDLLNTSSFLEFQDRQAGANKIRRDILQWRVTLLQASIFELFSQLLHIQWRSSAVNGSRIHCNTALTSLAHASVS